MNKLFSLIFAGLVAIQITPTPGPVILQEQQSAGQVTVYEPQSGRIWQGQKDGSGQAYLVPVNPGAIPTVPPEQPRKSSESPLDIP